MLVKKGRRRYRRSCVEIRACGQSRGLPGSSRPYRVEEQEIQSDQRALNDVIFTKVWTEERQQGEPLGEKQGTGI